MIVFDQVRISDDGKVFYLDAHVKTSASFSDVYITKLAVMRDTEMSETSATEFPESSYAYFEGWDIDVELKEVHRVITLNEFNAVLNTEHLPTMTDLSHNLFFVYIECEGTPSFDTPCNSYNNPSIAAAYDTRRIYSIGMNYVRELSVDCTIPSGFIDFILNNEALKFAINTGHYIPAKQYFNNVMGYSRGNVGTIKNCGCHG